MRHRGMAISYHGGTTAAGIRARAERKKHVALIRARVALVWARGADEVGAMAWAHKHTLSGHQGCGTGDMAARGASSPQGSGGDGIRAWEALMWTCVGHRQIRYTIFGITAREHAVLLITALRVPFRPQTPGAQPIPSAVVLYACVFSCMR